MKTVRNLAVASTLLVATTAFAEDAHHPKDAAPTAEASPMPGGPQGGMGAGMMPMAGMMNDRSMPMMAMMNGGAMSMMAPGHIEGRLAFFKAELKITEAQEKLWDTFAEAVRSNAQAMGGMMSAMQGAMMQGQGKSAETVVRRLEAHERMLTDRLDSLRKLKAALEPLYAALDEKQKRTADELLLPIPMGPM